MSTAIDFGSLLRRAKKPAPGGKVAQPTASPQESVANCKVLFSLRPKQDLGLFKIAFTGVFYIPDFISVEEEIDLLSDINEPNSLPKWTQLSKRRLKMIGGVPSLSGTVKEPPPAWAERFIDAMMQAGIPFPERPNHILLNEYSGGMGIAPHFDSNLYQPYVAVLSLQRPAMFDFFGPSPNQDGDTTGDSLGHSSVAHLYMEPRSLLIFSETAFSDVKHGILSRTYDEIDSATLNLHLLKAASVHQRWSRDAKLLAAEETPSEEDSKAFAPRLSLTIRALSRLSDSEMLETGAQREELRHRTAAFFKSVSESVQ